MAMARSSLFGLFASALLALALVLDACSNAQPPGAELGSAFVPTGNGSGCDDAHPVEGCPCSSVGTTGECGTVHEVVDGKVECSLGHTTCLAEGAQKSWGACTSERIVVQSMPSLSFQAYGSAGACAEPCTPNCSTTKDTPSGLTYPPGLVEGDAGLTLQPAPPPPNSCTGLTITPSSAPATDVVVTSTTTLATKTFTSDLVPAGCNPLAPSPLWYTDKFDIAQMDPNTPGKLAVIVPIAETVTVGATLGTLSATVKSKITVQIQEKGTTNPPPASASFAQFPAETASDPIDTNLTLLYPYNDTMLPLGLAAPLVQWKNNGSAASGGVVVTLQYPATGTPIFQASQLVAETTTAPVPLRTAQPRHAIPQSLWFAFEQTIHRNRATYGDLGRISVRRRVGSTTYRAKNVDVHIAPGQLKGRVYYNSYGTALVNNYTGAKQTTGGAFPNGAFGAATLVIPVGGTSPTVAAGYNGTGGCYVCHSASADGATLVTSSDSPYKATKYTFPGTPPNGGTSFGSAAMVFGAVNPTSTRMMSSAGAYSGDSTSRLFDINGTVISGNNAPANLKAGYPSFAPDGKSVVFTFRGGDAKPLANLSGDGSTVSMMTFDGNKTFSNFRNLVTPSGGPSVWPAFLPTGQNGVVYEVETRTTSNGGYSYTRHDCECSTYSGATGELWWVSTGATPIATRLHRANGYDATGTTGVLPEEPTTGHAVYGGTNGPAGAGFYEQRYNYEPTVLAQTIGGYSWVAFTSRRQYGNVATINPYASDPRYDNISIDPTTKKLWVAAINSSPTPGTDPSWPAFYLPGQELIAGNSRAVFALEACHPAVASNPGPANLCDSDLDCCGAPATASCTLDPPPLANPPVKHCISTSAGTCRNVGESCLSTSQCCNAVSGGVCANGVCTDPPPYFEEQQFTRDYTSNCTRGFMSKWGLFEWQSVTPTGTTIKFYAQGGDGKTWSPATPIQFAAASGSSVLAPSWGNSGVTVSSALGQPNGTPSVTQVRITMKLSASTDHARAPTLIDWRQTLVCVPVE